MSRKRVTWSRPGRYAYGGVVALSLVTAGICRAQSISAAGDVSPTPPAPLPTGNAWNLGGALYVGQSGTGELRVDGAASVVNVSNGYVGYYVGSEGVVTIHGSGTAWELGNLGLGVEGKGMLIVEAGGAPAAQTRVWVSLQGRMVRCW